MAHLFRILAASSFNKNVMETDGHHMTVSFACCNQIKNKFKRKTGGHNANTKLTLSEFKKITF